MFSCKYCKIFKNTCFKEYQQTAASEENIQTSSVFFFLWDERCVPDQIDTTLQSKRRDKNKRDKHSSKLAPKFLHMQHKMLF